MNKEGKRERKPNTHQHHPFTPLKAHY